MRCGSMLTVAGGAKMREGGETTNCPGAARAWLGDGEAEWTEAVWRVSQEEESEREEMDIVLWEEWDARYLGYPREMDDLLGGLQERKAGGVAQGLQQHRERQARVCRGAVNPKDEGSQYNPPYNNTHQF